MATSASNLARPTQSDVSQAKDCVRAEPFQPANFRVDVNTNGAINSSDVSQIKANSGSSVSASGNAQKIPAAPGQKR